MFEFLSKSEPIGFLTPEQDYPRGEVSEDAVDRLADQVSTRSGHGADTMIVSWPHVDRGSFGQS